MKAKFRVLICLLTITPVWAQLDNATLTGLITDPSSAVISGAKIKARNTTTNVERLAESDAGGYYFFATLTAGPYEISVEQPGFQRVVKEVTVETGQKARQ